jgi:hypothetical protein
MNSHDSKCGKDRPEVNKCTCRVAPEPGTRRWSEMFGCYIILVRWDDEYHFTYHLEDSRYILPNQNNWFNLSVHDPKKFTSTGENNGR